MLKKHLFIYLLALFLFTSSILNAQIVLLGDNAPHSNVNDGDFSTVWDYWRNAKQSPFWKTYPVIGEEPMGLHYGTLFCSNDEGIAESKILNTNKAYQKTKTGDILNWSFGADLEYICNGTISLSLVFGDSERIIAEKVKLIGADKTAEHFKGTYTLTEADAKAGLPFVRVHFYSEQGVKVYLHYVNINVLSKEKTGPQLDAEVPQNGIRLNWVDTKSNNNSKFNVYRSDGKKDNYKKIAQTSEKHFLDTDLIHGISYTYLVTRMDNSESGPSNKVSITKKDNEKPAPPKNLKIKAYDSELALSWSKSLEPDVAYYSIQRGNEDGTNMKEIATEIKSANYEDILPLKEVENSYIIYAHDYSGNKSIASERIKGKVNIINGASFSDLIQPMPIHKKLSSNLWGTSGVLPRDPDNGIEHPDWSYWGGRPILDKDNKYHMLVTRWPEGALKGHWEWPTSTVTHVVSDKPTGPYLVKEDTAYSFNDGLGHNPDIIKLNDGSYALYSLIDWEPTIFTSKSMNGPWKRQGILTVASKEANPNDTRDYQYYRNLSGVQLKDGRIIIVSKFGCMLISDNGLLGPYNVVTKTINHNTTIPKRYRKSNYEDPVMWKDDVQYHLLINAFLDYRAIYLRSADGIHWKYDPGLAYTPDFTYYEDGTKTSWYKLERPHVLQDKYGRATHLSLAVIDVPKKDDYANDKHNSKNIIIPLTVHKRIKILNKTAVNATTKRIKIHILSEDGFDAQTAIDISSLRFGASEAVNYGRGAKVVKVKNKGKDLYVEFNGNKTEITDNNFACKLYGKTKSGDLIIAFYKLKAE